MNRSFFNKRKPQRVIIIRSDHLGDLVLTTPLVRALAKAGHIVDFIAPKATASILDHNPYLNSIWKLESISPHFPKNWLALSKQLRANRYDVIILPHARPWQLLLAARASGIPRRLAMWSGWQGRLLANHCLRSGLPRNSRPFSKIMLDFACELGVDHDGLVPDVFLTLNEITLAEKLIASQLTGCRKIIGIHPGCAGNTCNLPTASYSALATRLLQEPDLGIIITGSSAESHLLEPWPSDLIASERVWNSIGLLTLRELAAVIDCLDLFIVPSTGPLHIASARGVATLSPFCSLSPLSPEIWGNYGASAMVETPPVHTCFNRNNRSHCDFRGEITSAHLATRALNYLSNIKK